jgi:hypothetical protein
VKVEQMCFFYQESSKKIITQSGRRRETVYYWSDDLIVLLHLHPNIACITSMDADHLDIYGTSDAIKESFVEIYK